MSIMFNHICINKEILPKYTYFKLYDPTAHKYNSTLQYRRDLEKRQITLCKNNINISSPDDGPKFGRKYLGNNQFWKVCQPIPAEYHKIDTAIRKD